MVMLGHVVGLDRLRASTRACTWACALARTCHFG